MQLDFGTTLLLNTQSSFYRLFVNYEFYGLLSAGRVALNPGRLSAVET